MIPNDFICSDTIAAMEQFFSPEAAARNTFRGPCFMLPVEGEAIAEIDGWPYHLRPGVLISLLPGHLLRTLSRNDKFRCCCLAFTFDFMNDFPYLLRSQISEEMAQIPYRELREDREKQLFSYYNTIATHFVRTSHHSYKEILRSLAFVFTAEVCAIYADSQVKSTRTFQEELTDRFFHLLHAHFYTIRDTTSYAARLCVTPKHLARVVRQVTGHPPTYWFADFTIREICALLCSTSLSITELAYKLNFPSSSLLARYFRRHMGKSPQEYRLHSSPPTPTT